MARRVKKRSFWRSSARKKAYATWFHLSQANIAAPTASTTDAENLFSETDYADADVLAQNPKVLVKRILFSMAWNPTSELSSSSGASMTVRMGLGKLSPDQNAAAVTAGLNPWNMDVIGAKLLRVKTFRFTELDQNTAVGVMRAPRYPNWDLSLKTNIVLTRPDALYLWQQRIDTDGAAENYEFAYDVRILFQRLS